MVRGDPSSDDRGAARPCGPPAPAIVILNPSAGDPRAAERLRALIEAAAAGRKLQIIEALTASALPQLANRAVEQARETGAVVVAAGGDGTVSTVAAACFMHSVPLGVVPLGTFNYFAREWGLPEDPADALECALNGMRALVDVGFINGRLFINNASFGIYPRLIRERESTKSRLGRRRWVARLAALASMLRGPRRFAVSMEADGVRQVRRATMVFVGNNALQLQQLGLAVADCVGQGRLAVIVQPPLARLQRLRQLLLGLFGWLQQETELERFCASTLVVDSKRRMIELAVDGELIRLPPPLVFSKGRRSLILMRPAQEASA